MIDPLLSYNILPRCYFGEGITYFSDHSISQPPKPLIAQFTWKENTGFIYDASALEQMREVTFRTTAGEGWGITYDDSSSSNGEFIVSDGGEYLHFWDGITLEELRRARVVIENKDGEYYHDIEYCDGMIFLDYLDEISVQPHSCTAYTTSFIVTIE